MSLKKRSFFAGACTLAAAALLLSTGTAALAAPTIEPDQRGSITFHKFEQPDTLGDPVTGQVLDTDGLTPMQGVQFTAKKVDVDLTTNTGWVAAAEMSAASAEQNLDSEFGARTSEATDADGETILDQLPVGLYLITETSYPTGVTPAAPFLITIPLTNPENSSEWMYDVHVYPKNATVGVDKSVEDAGTVHIGQEITWTIRADIPKVEAIDGYKFVDNLDDRLSWVSTSVSLSNTSISLESEDYTPEHDNGEVTVTFTPAGREKLAAVWQSDPSAQVVVKITTEVNAVGEITNEAVLYPNEASFSKDPGTPGGPPEAPQAQTKFGNIVLQKVDATDSSITLSGAEFQVFRSEADAKNGTGPISIRGEDTFTSGEDGIVIIAGLRYTAFANGNDLDEGDPEYQSYWVVETKAPSAAYELLAEPFEVVVGSADPDAITIVVENVPANVGFALPRTGATGTAALTIAGVLLLGGALVLGIRRRSSN